MGKKVHTAKGLTSVAGNTFRQSPEVSQPSKVDLVTREVVTAFVGGDHGAFDTIYMNYSEPIRAFFKLLLRDESQAGDLCQDLFVRLWENRHTINPELNFRSYLYTVAKSSALKSLRHKKVVDKYLNFALVTSSDEGMAADKDLEVRETELMLRIALDGMPEQRRKVFEMSRLEDVPNDDIARRLGITESTVRAHLHNALKKLKRLSLILILFFVYA